MKANCEPMTDGLVSVILPCYNDEDWLPDTVESVLDQSYGQIELILVDDGSTDETSKIAKSYESRGEVKYIRQDNQGPSAARNTGLEAASGEYIAFVDADDIWKPDKLERQVDFLSQSDAGFVHTNAWHIDEDGNKIERRHESNPIRWNDRKQFIKDLFLRNPICISSVLVSHSALGDKRFDEKLLRSNDQDLWLKIAGDAKFGYIEDPLVQYRLRESGISNDYRLVFKARKRIAENAIERYPFLEDLRDRKFSSIYLTHGINLSADNNLKEAREAFRIAFQYNTMNWKIYGAYLLSFLRNGIDYYYRIRDTPFGD